MAAGTGLLAKMAESIKQSRKCVDWQLALDLPAFSNSSYVELHAGIFEFHASIFMPAPECGQMPLELPASSNSSYVELYAGIFELHASIFIPAPVCC